MGVQRVILTGVGDSYAPATKEIDISVIGRNVFITVYKGSLEDLIEGRKKEYEVPVLDLQDLLNALNAFGVSQGVLLLPPREE